MTKATQHYPHEIKSSNIIHKIITKNHKIRFLYIKNEKLMAAQPQIKLHKTTIKYVVITKTLTNIKTHTCKGQDTTSHYLVV